MRDEEQNKSKSSSPLPHLTENCLQRLMVGKIFPLFNTRNRLLPVPFPGPGFRMGPTLFITLFNNGRRTWRGATKKKEEGSQLRL